MGERSTAARLRRLPRVRALGIEVAVADDILARLLGLAWLDRGRAGPGLLIPRCSRIHTFGMRFALDVAFLGRDGRAVEIRTAVPARQFIARRGAWAVLEIPSPPDQRIDARSLPIDSHLLTPYFSSAVEAARLEHEERKPG